MDNGNHSRWQRIGLAGALLLTLGLLGCPGSLPRPRPPADNPLPTLTSLSPSSVTAGGAAFTLTVTGTGFVAGSVVRLDGSARVTTFINSTQLEAAITAADIVAAGTPQITVFNPAPGGGTSNPLTLTVTLDRPVPAITALSPAAVTAGGSAFTLTVTGTDFVAASVVQVDGAARVTTFISSTELEATVTAADIASTGTAQITVFTPAPGGGTSNTLNLTVTPSIPGTTARISRSTAGTQGNGESGLPAISATGRFVAFASLADNLVSGDTNGVADIFLHDTCVGAAPSCTPSTVRVSVSSNGTQGDNPSFSPTISDDGRFVAFESSASNLVASDTNGASDVFLRDTCFGAGAGCSPSTVLLSVSSSGTAGAADSTSAAISGDGRFVAFESFANNLIASDTNGNFDVFLRDTCFGAAAGCSPSTVRVSVSSSGVEGDSESLAPALSDNGRFIAFLSFASNLVVNDTNGSFDIFVRDTCFGAGGCSASTRRVSVTSSGAQAGADSIFPSISSNGRFVAFHSFATDLVTGDTNGTFDVFVHDRDTDNDGIFDEAGSIATRRISVTSGGAEAGGNSGFASISADGRFIAFESDANDLVAGDTNGAFDIFVRDRDTDNDGIFDEASAVATRRVSVSASGIEGSQASTAAVLSRRGPFVAFQSNADNLVAGDTNGVGDVFVAVTGF